MIGIDRDGAFAGYVDVPARAVHPLPDSVSLVAGAYAEPVAASLAVIKAAIRPNDQGLVHGDNRIARLTRRILDAKGFAHIESGAGPFPANHFDFVIETEASEQALGSVFDCVRPGGTVVLKSRRATPTPLATRVAVEKELTIQGTHYGSFSEGLELLASGKLRLDDLCGDLNPLEDFARVFAAERRGEDLKQFFILGDPSDVWHPRHC